MQAKYQEDDFVGEVSNPRMSSEIPGRLEIKLRTSQKKNVDFGAAYLTTEEGGGYPCIVQKIRNLQGIQEHQHEFEVTLESGIFPQMEHTRLLFQKQKPIIPMFVGDVVDHFLLPVVTHNYVGIRIQPVPQDTLLNPEGVLRPYGNIHLISSSGESHMAVIRGSSRPYFNISNPGGIWMQDLSIEGVSFEQARKIEKIIQLGGPQATTAIGNVMDIQSITNGAKKVELRISMLQTGLMCKSGGETQTISKSGQWFPISIQSIATLSSSTPKSSRKSQNTYFMTVENMTVEQAADWRMIIQEPPPLEIGV